MLWPWGHLLALQRKSGKSGFEMGLFILKKISWETQECRKEELLGVRKAIHSLVNASLAKRASLHGANHLQTVCLDEWL